MKINLLTVSIEEQKSTALDERYWSQPNFGQTSAVLSIVPANAKWIELYRNNTQVRIQMCDYLPLLRWWPTAGLLGAANLAHLLARLVISSRILTCIIAYLLSLLLLFLQHCSLMVAVLRWATTRLAHLYLLIFKLIIKPFDSLI